MNKHTKTLIAKIALISGLLQSCHSPGGSVSEKTILDLQHSPSPYECLILSKHAYGNNLTEGEPVAELNAKLNLNANDGWIVYRKLGKDDGSSHQLFGITPRSSEPPYGYSGVIYKNTKKNQFVLANRGTDPTRMDDLMTDINSVARGSIGRGQERAMSWAVEEFVETVKQQQGSLLSLTTTGHSLGGWLAQIAAFIATIKYGFSPSELHIKAITFDTPGAEPMLGKLKPNINGDSYKLSHLDITNYLSVPNLINTCNRHVGTVYRVIFKKFEQKLIRYTLQSHDLQEFIDAFDSTTRDAHKMDHMKSWPASTGQYRGFQKISQQTERDVVDNLDDFQDFELVYENKYCTCDLTNESRLHVRHCPEPVLRFLRNLGNSDQACLEAIKEDQELRGTKLSYRESSDWVENEASLRIDLRIVVDRLLSKVLSNPELIRTTNPRSYIRIPLPLPPRVPFFVGREQLLEDLKKAFHIQQGLIAITLTGSGGIGKTQLARRVWEEQEKTTQYDHMLWISAESEEKLLDAYSSIATSLRIDVRATANSMQTTKMVLELLKDKYCFYVFDGALDVKAIESFLPLEKGHVLITSRNSDIGVWRTTPLVLQPFNEQEAITLAQKFNHCQSLQEQETLQEFLSKLPCSPLTLVQAFSTLERSGLDIMDFAEKLQTRTVTDQVLINLLDNDPQPRVGYREKENTIRVLGQSLDQLSKEEKGKSATQLLRNLSYLDPRDIPVKWLLTWDKEDADPLNNETRAALALLEQYSLIQWSRTDKQIYIHADTQLIFRHLYSEDADQVLNTTVNALVNYESGKKISQQNKEMLSQLLPHGRILFKWLDKKWLDKDNYPREAYVLTDYLTEVCRETCRFKESVEWAQKCLNLTESLYPDQDHPQIAYNLNRLGVSLKEIGDHKQALRRQKSALEMRERISSQDPDNADKKEAVARSLSEVGGSLAQLGRHDEALEYKKQSLKIRQRLFGNQDHPEIAHSLNSIGELLTHLGQYEEALKYKQLALGVRQRFYNNSDHRDIARSLTGVGIGLEDLGKYQKALETKKKLWLCINVFTKIRIIPT